MNLYNFHGKVALVTGASRGIGKEISKKLTMLGAKVVGTSSTEEGVKKINEMLNENNGVGIPLNALSKVSCEICVKWIQNKLGNIDILVNNAGIKCDALTQKMSMASWENVLNVNLHSVFWLSKFVSRMMIKENWGRIINITSAIGFLGNIGQTNYSAAKFGVTGMTKSLACELGRKNITVNCVAPGFIETDMIKTIDKNINIMKIPLNRFGTTSDVANAVIFLASENASYITGSTIHVNGGIYM